MPSFAIRLREGKREKLKEGGTPRFDRGPWKTKGFFCGERILMGETFHSVGPNRNPSMTDRVIGAVIQTNMYNLGGIMGKYFVRGIVPWDQIQADCLRSVGNDFLCSLASFDSAPGAVQSFMATFGVAVGLVTLLNKTDFDRKIVNLAASITFSLVLLGEFAEAYLHATSINVADITTETVGMIPAYLLLGLVTRRGVDL